MQLGEPNQAAAEDATADLLRLAFIEIRFLTSPLHDDQSPDAVSRRREQASTIADTCHGLPGLLATRRRHHLFDGLRYLWRTASAGKRQWLRSRWDQLSYDHRWLTEPGSETAPGVTSEQKLD
jgi:hypothetical protein